jgi:antitoxin component YwqK of YwqJK toxin-antitoxin module
MKYIMKTKFSIVLLILQVALTEFYGQDVKVNNGYTKIYYPNGKVSSEGTMRNGSPDGYWKTYFPTGIIKSEGNRRNHMLDSIWVFYNETGDTLEKVFYMMGKRNGYVTEYKYQDVKDPIHKGKVVSRELYVNDKRAGKSFYYYENGKIKEVVDFMDNKRNGNSVEYDQKGNIISVQRFINGVLVERERLNRVDQKGMKQGVWKEFYDNGKVRKEASYIDDQLNGYYKEYDENGLVKVLFQYVNGKLLEKSDTTEMEIEVRNQYDSLGNVIFSGSYKKDRPVGIHRMFNKEGKVINSFLFNDNGLKIGEGIITPEGKKEGPWSYFYDDGKVRSKGNYSNNLETGNWKYFFEDGKTEQLGVFKNGKFDGTWQWFYKTGNIKREEDYFEGHEEGNSIEYDSTGNVIAKGSYFDGLKEGDWYYQVGDYMEKGKYVGDLKDGKWLAYYADGHLEYEGNYLQGNPDGEHIYYYINGKVKEIDTYVMGIADKNWKKFDDKGNLLITITYKDNREYRINGQKIDFEKEDIKLIQ